MTIFTLILGLIIGFFLKFGFDELHYWKNNLEKIVDKNEDLYIKMKALELNKELDK
ncbi:MAG: hypothetical protein ACOYMA_17510 [Bacteroidia bacterium]